MKEQKGYVPPLYVPLGQSDADTYEDNDSLSRGIENTSTRKQIVSDPTQWSSGICACCDDMQSCCFGTVCPCYLFAKNAEHLGSETLAGSCMTHFTLWSVMNCLCCAFTGGLLFLVPGATVACYACGYRKALRSKYNLQEAPCGDLNTHIFCHLCAICQEHREIRERSDSSSSILALAAPQVQAMESSKVEPA